MPFSLNSIRSSSRFVARFSVLALSLSLAACGGSNTTTSTAPNATPGTEGSANNTPAPSPAQLVALEQPVALIGAGASFPAPLYQRWASDISSGTKNLQIDYQSVGSGAGVERFVQGLVQFGASDVAMTDEEIAKVPNGVLLLPMTAGSIVLAYNIPDVGEVKLSQQNLIDIFLGKITNWNDPALATDNQGVTFPDLPIQVIYRSDGSGTTGVFTKNLAAMSEDWNSTVGEGKTVQWPVGIGGKGNEGVTAQISQTPGSIGYIEYGFAKSANLKMASLQNKAGNFIQPNDESAAKTLEFVELPENLRAFITNPEGAESYPIVSYSWIMAYQKYDKPETAKSVEAMIQYGLTEGQKVSPQLGYIPLPAAVVKKVAAKADQISPDFTIKVE
ncbi:phosphate ABC transporter substrate-binding protein PstS [Planktothrix agardhii]|uniref:phosphate ABC transporter substrate-binding protein PstS n=1 Tax=Planktothrix agardhii TaxID=1160 RepID=UPI001D0A3336|nr:phosphate ABC transporter substrate-binding protein PstS [Planktothrix agardhii]MCB8784904.1 phosphate ABC transporter substrate-binding protein PstS [Planktothrix agardhii 1025]MCF3611067.1 phosphate ABC transporter substrate-binding protein PstS [Planktothrix agardhii 1027]MCF3644720.1 phosphate ABC transporter substrate-binding protein PstS [Planktothrix agardhii 1026]MCF3647261.1 phosphate ABC transporter substrate-binding protein PstS [Planktothrix agardhii 1026]MEA5562211.1 phosphate 